RVNTIMVLLKIGILVFFCIVAFTAFDGNNLEPFLPLGLLGVTAAAGQVFFSYIGFDAASTAGEEAKNPRRDLPFAIIGSLLVVTVLYLAVTIAALGARPWESFEGQGSEAVLASVANEAVGGTWAGNLIAVGAIISIFSVVLVTLYGQTRILFAMGRDGLLPKVFTRVSPRSQTPVNNTIIVCCIIAVPAAFVSLGQLAEATSIGTLGAFAVVNIGVIVLRRKYPDLPRGFTTPLFPLFPILGLILIAVIIAGLDPVTWLVFALWMAVGFAIYFAYSRRHSLLNAPK
ncbi:MAG: amino acid permease, partial [Candidatus Nanopelagicales bacterium]